MYAHIARDLQKNDHISTSQKAVGLRDVLDAMVKLPKTVVARF
jgi:ribosomal protein L17